MLHRRTAGRIGSDGIYFFSLQLHARRMTLRGLIQFPELQAHVLDEIVTISRRSRCSRDNAGF